MEITKELIVPGNVFTSGFKTRRVVSVEGGIGGIVTYEWYDIRMSRKDGFSRTTYKDCFLSLFNDFYWEEV